MSASPTVAFLFHHPAHFLALGFGAGLSPVAPGTFGTLVAIPLAFLLHAFASDWEFVAVVAVLFVIGAWARVAGAFVIFRLFDIVKPPPIRQLDTALKNGIGVMLDDLLAAGYTLIVFALWQRLFG